MSKWTENSIPDLSGKNIIVTGGNSGLGFESVKSFAWNGADVILACRSIEKGEKAKMQIGNVPGNIEVMHLDLQDFNSIELFAEKFKSKYYWLDVLLNNAGIMSTPYFKTRDGFEGQMGTNHFGHFKLTSLLLDMIIGTPNSRVVNVSSMGHIAGKMDFNNLMYENGGYSPARAYARTKLSNLLFTYELQRFFEANKIDSIAVAAHPGISETNLNRHADKKTGFRMLSGFFKLLGQDAAQGALPQIRACTDPHVNGGEYYGPGGFLQAKGNPIYRKSNKASYNKEDARKLWEISERLTGVKLSFNSRVDEKINIS